MSGFGVFTSANLTEINVSKDNDYYSSVDGILFNKNQSVLLRFPSAKEISYFELPNTVSHIDNDAFSGNKYLKNIKLSNCYIGNRAFGGCSSLENITFSGVVGISSYYTFSSCSKLKSVELPENITSIQYQTFSSCINLTDLVIPNNVKSIEKEACYNCQNLRNITFKGTIEEWNNIKKVDGWNYNVPCTTVVCTDGIADL